MLLFQPISKLKDQKLQQVGTLNLVLLATGIIDALDQNIENLGPYFERAIHNIPIDQFEGIFNVTIILVKPFLKQREQVDLIDVDHFCLFNNHGVEIDHVGRFLFKNENQRVH